MRSRSGTGAGAGLGVGEEQRERERKASTETEAGIKRRKELAEMLREVFKLEEVEEVVGELACWLLRSVLLQGYMYLTTGHVCFYAHMPAKSENKIIKSGPLSKKSNRKIGSSTKYWFILKNAVLSWYVSSADPYFPHGNVDLQYAIDCEAVDEKTIKLTTNRRSYTFTSDTAASREEWVKAIRKVMFRTQHEGENVKIAIPLEAILDVETTSTMDFAETIEIKVVEGDEATLSFDSYFFAYFTNIDAALVQIREVLTTYRPQEQGSAPGWEKEQVYDTTMMKGGGRRGSSPAEGAVKPSGSSSLSRIGSLLHPFSSGSSKSSPTVSVAQSPRRSGEFSSGPAPIPITSARRSRDLERDSSIARLSTTPDSVRTVTPPPSTTSSSSTPNKHVSYPPSTASGPPPPGLELVHTSSTSSWAPSNFIRRPSMKIFSSGASGASSLLSSVRPTSLIGRRKGGGAGGRRKPVVVQERVENVMAGGGTDVSFSEDSTDGYASEGGARRGGGSEMGGFSMLEKSETVDREEMEADREFHEWFAMDKKELLLEHFAGFLFRVVPVSGKVFISTNHFCFKATALLYKTTMVIPIKDIIALQPQKAFRFGHHGLAVVIKGHEELFLEFSSSERRDACKSLLEQQMDQLRFKALHGPQPVSDQQQEALILQDLDTMGFSSPQRRTNKHGRHSREVSSGGGTDVGRSHSSPGSGYGSDHLPPVMFTSTESTFLDFKPKEPMHITCLTIGSRGDVQPYIALCKGLKAEGHRVRIASHGEYKDWIEGHGIEFGYVGGDPAELMRICIENGMFTVSFIKEGLNKFREWIDDLLVTSWEACQGTDLLIESPSAMGGIHIAEGLGIPYYRAFTMPWSRTRAYPHAFAVPDHHRGGSYNYMTYTMFDQVFWRAISGQINRWRKKVIGISSTNLDKLEPHKVPFLYNFSPTVVPPPLDWYEWIRITGYWFLDDPDDSANKKWSPPDGLLDFMSKARNDGKKIVYIGFGSIVVSDPDAMTACVVQSVLESDVRVILSKGWSDRLQTKKDVAPGEEPPAEETPEEKAAKEKTKIAKEREMFPAEVFPIASVPHDWLFPRIDAACHHGGAGTTGASLRAGIPTIILPFFGDQYFWADRVEVLGVGSGMKKLTQDHLTAALKTATTDEKQIRKAKALGEEIRAENGVSTAIESIYRDLEYARSLIKHPHASSSSSSSAESSPTSSPVSSPVVQTTPLPSHSRSESITPPPPGSDESWDVVTGEDQRRSSEGGSGSGSGRGGGSSRSSKVSGGLGLVGSVVNGVVGGIGGKLGIGK
ncbi:hypothetical protein BDY24DRAFT_374148 [Mrakia frigida]|uniref:uncharacterized protein n=1 Tax=Mrakia frigida TaxID=29902 RepID=UPI003FCC197C